MSADPNKKTPRTFQCRDVLWETFEQMAQELECSIDYLINESMKQYARQRSYGGGRTPLPGQPPSSQSGKMPAPPMPLTRGRGLPAPPGKRPKSMPPPAPSAGGGRLPAPPSGGGGMGLPPPPRRSAPPGPPPGSGAGKPLPPPGSGGGRMPLPPPPSGGRGPAPGLPPLPSSSARPSAPPPLPPPPGGGRAPGFPAPPQQPAPAPARGLSALYNGAKVPVTKDRFIVGRGKQSSDLTIKDPNVSRQHAMIEFLNGQYYMVDMGSTNGVEFNGQRIARKVIAEGDIFRICDHEVRFTFQ